MKGFLSGSVPYKYCSYVSGSGAGTLIYTYVTRSDSFCVSYVFVENSLCYFFTGQLYPRKKMPKQENSED
jgi:hypothetical protein